MQRLPSGRKVSSLLATGKRTMAKELKVTLKKSVIGRPEKHRRILSSLKLTKTNKTVHCSDTPEARGKLRKVSHLIEVEEIN